MTRKHSEAAAAIVRTLVSQALTADTARKRADYRDTAAAAAGAYISLFRQFNPRFNEERFLEACNLGAIK